MKGIVTFFEMEVEEITRVSQETLAQDIEALEEDCAYTIETVEDETRNKIAALIEQQSADLIDEIAELRESWED